MDDNNVVTRDGGADVSADGEFKPETYFHSVRLAAERCIGCTHCVRECPTEAIRVRFGKARINPFRCVDCGNCIRTCPTRAKYAQTDKLEDLKRFRYNVAIPSSAFAGQFKSSLPLDKVLSGLISLGFDEVYEGALGGEIISLATREYLSRPDRVKPVVSSLCPAVVRLIQVRFPSLLGHIIPVEAPMDAAARIVKTSRAAKLGIPPQDIGVFFLTACPAKVTAIKQPVAAGHTMIDGAIPISDIFNRLMKCLDRVQVQPGISRASGTGLGWGAAGGENRTLGVGRRMAVDGIHNVVRVLEMVEDEELDEYDYLELRACTGGCVGGALTAEEPFVAKQRVNDLRVRRGDQPGIANPLPYEPTYEEIQQMVRDGVFNLRSEVQPRTTLQLGTDMAETIARMKKLEDLLVNLPGIDCGSCGAPTCRAFAEDVVLGRAQIFDCTFKLREALQKLAKEMSILSEQLPPTLKSTEKVAEDGDL